MNIKNKIRPSVLITAIIFVVILTIYLVSKYFNNIMVSPIGIYIFYLWIACTLIGPFVFIIGVSNKSEEGKTAIKIGCLMTIFGLLGLAFIAQSCVNGFRNL